MKITQWAIVGGVLSIIGGEVLKISGWHEVMTPSFVGGVLVQIAGLIAAVAGALYTPKPLGNGNGGNVDPKRFIGPVVGLLFAVLLLGGCGLHGKPLTVAMEGNISLKSALVGFEAVLDEQHQAGMMTEAEFREWNVRLSPVIDVGNQINEIIDAWPSGTPAPPELVGLVGEIRPLVERLVAYLPASAVRAALQDNMGLIEMAVKAIVARFGGGS